MRVAKTSALVVAAFLGACGGGVGQNQVPAPNTVRSGLDYGYFQTADGQLAATSGSVTFLHLQDDSAYGDPAARQWREDQMVARLQEAQALGPRRAIVSIGYLIFDAQFRYVGIADLEAFRERLDSLGLLPMVKWLYVVDEPELHGISNATMIQAEADARADWPNVKLVVVYSSKGPTPGIAGLDIVGRDDYGNGIGVTDELPSITASQQYVLLPGGADPWRTDPIPFLDYANSHANVAMIWPFLWGPYQTGNGTMAGIATNGEAPTYTALGCRITMAC